jgi:hypothetical protein
MEEKLSSKKIKRRVEKEVVDDAWDKIFKAYRLDKFDFDSRLFRISSSQIKEITNKEPRILCKHDTRESRPSVFKERGLFILPVKNEDYVVLKGEGYVEIPPIEGVAQDYESKLDFELKTLKVGNSQIQHLDFAYASSLVRTFNEDDSLVLIIRGRKYTPKFSFRVGDKTLDIESVQTEVDAGYEGIGQIVLIEAKNSKATNTIIRQMFYPFRQWKRHTRKDVVTLFFEKSGDEYSFWQFEFADENDYNSIQLVRSVKYKIKG